MGFADTNPQAWEDELMRRVRSGPQAQPEGFSVWSFAKAGLAGIPQAGLEVLGSIRDLGAQVDRRTQEAENARAVIGNRQPRQMNQMPDGTSLRAKADELAPNPLTAHTADKVLNNVTRFTAKAVGAVATMGPAGAVALGAEEANTAAQRLMEGGVDPSTAWKVGGVTGTLSTVGAVLPIGGGTAAKTAALALVGGPVSFMAQEGLAREILQRGGYAEKAAEHDPTDSLGLILSTIPGAALGGLHMRGVARRAKAVEGGGVPLEQMTLAERKGLKYSDARFDAYAEAAAEKHGVPPAVLLAIKNAGEKSNPTATSPKGAQGVMQFMPDTAKEMGIADPTDPAQAIDGAARYMRKLFDAYGSWDAAVAHYNGGGSQAALVRAGGKPSFKETAAYLERVQAYVREHTTTKAAADPEIEAAARVRVTEDALQQGLPDVAGARAAVVSAADELATGRVPDVPNFAAQAQADSLHLNIKTLEAEREALLPTAGNLADRGEVAKVRAELAALEQNRPDDSPQAVKAVAKEIQSAEQVSYKTALSKAEKLTAERVNNFNAAASRLQDFIAKNAESQQATNRLAEVDGLIAKSKAQLEEIGPYLPARNPLASAVSQAVDSMRGTLQPTGIDGALGQPRSPYGANSLPDAASQARPEPASPAGRGASQAKAETPPIDSQRLKQIEAETPDMQVILPGETQAMSVADALAQARAVSAEEAGFAKLLKVAADCAVTFG